MIAVDAMGGDHAPRAVVEGALAAAREDGAQLLLVGARELLAKELLALGASDSDFELVEADQVVTMSDSATAPLRSKRHSSVRVCGDLVKNGRATAFVSAGNTGAAMIVAKLVVGTVDGVDRPALAGVFPNAHGKTVVLDVGANVDSKPEQLREFAIMGHSYAHEVLGVPRPRVGLLSIGAEDGKGDDFTNQVFDELETSSLNFVGNVEGSDVFSGAVDVIVCDGFVGNAILKSSESLVEFVVSTLRKELRASWLSRVGYLLSQPAFRAFRKHTDYEEYGAAPLLGVRGGCFIAHGRSTPRAIHSAIRRAVEFGAADVAGKIRDRIAELHAQEALLRGNEETGERPTR